MKTLEIDSKKKKKILINAVRNFSTNKSSVCLIEGASGDVKTFRIILPLDSLYKFKRSYLPLPGQPMVSISKSKSISLVPNYRGVELLVKYLLLEYKVLEFILFSKKCPKEGLCSVPLRYQFSFKTENKTNSPNFGKRPQL